MKRYIYLIILLVSTLAIVSCDTVESNSSNNKGGDWLIPENEVFDGGPGKDGIPSIDSPNFVDVASIDYLNDNDLVIVFSQGNEIRIYPHPILDWHEIINDKIGNTAFTITYCPLTGSAICWDRNIDGAETTFGVSGLLYNSNLIPYDRKTGSNWSQMLIKSVNGSLISTQVNTYPIIETSWATAKTSFQNAKVVTTNTGFSRNYNSYPYGDYRTNHSSFIFPTDKSDNRLNAKERVLGVFANDNTKAYRLNDFGNGKTLIDAIGNRRFLVYGNNQKNIITAFDISNISASTEFSISSSQNQYFIADNSGNLYDIFGKSNTAGGSELEPAKFFVAYWFAWSTFYPNTELYNN